MRIDLIADPSRQAPAWTLRDRLEKLLGPGYECGVIATTELAAALPNLVVLLVEGDRVAEAREACRRTCLTAPGCIVLAAGAEDAHAELETLLAAGAADLLYLPASDIEMLARIHRAASMAPAHQAAGGGAVDPRLAHVIGHSEPIRRLLMRLPRLSTSDAGIMIFGETGTGKEVFAQAVHRLSDRAGKPWVPINCGAIPVDLMEAELFGHVRGAYTGATSARAGLVEEADGGTLFLDDVDCLSLAAQSKLLRLLQEREFRPVGSNSLRHADIRVVAASNRDLEGEAGRGSFRKDLYYRLTELSFTLPPLRERREDIPPLASHFMRQYARQLRKPMSVMAPQAMRILSRHDWPGNVRELQHTIHRAVLLSPGAMLDQSDFQLGGGAAESAGEASFSGAKARLVRDFERDYIREALARCDGNITTAARESGKHRRAFFALMRKHGIEPPRASART
ncbi:sigma-54 dependent transcriptional regulator [Massilia aurea]|uniref:sigma-54 interaction domain-containing protein n=1 Tax=Massilia aurea TaxID=373040 RepID=UPI003461943A